MRNCGSGSLPGFSASRQQLEARNRLPPRASTDTPFNNLHTDDLNISQNLATLTSRISRSCTDVFAGACASFHTPLKRRQAGERLTVTTPDIVLQHPSRDPRSLLEGERFNFNQYLGFLPINKFVGNESCFVAFQSVFLFLRALRSDCTR